MQTSPLWSTLLSPDPSCPFYTVMEGVLAQCVYLGFNATPHKLSHAPSNPDGPSKVVCRPDFPAAACTPLALPYTSLALLSTSWRPATACLCHEHDEPSADRISGALMGQLTSNCAGGST